MRGGGTMGTAPCQEGRMGGTVPAPSRCLQNVLNMFLGTGGDDETRHQLQAWCGMPRKAENWQEHVPAVPDAQASVAGRVS